MYFHYTTRALDGLFVVLLLLLILVYLAPTFVAMALRSRHLVIVALVDIFLGWTMIGWIAAWVICFLGTRPGSPAYPLPSPYAPGAGLSPDGAYWWDGAAWRDTRVAAPPFAMRSPDGRWWWDGLRWRPVPPPPPV